MKLKTVLIITSHLFKELVYLHPQIFQCSLSSHPRTTISLTSLHLQPPPSTSLLLWLFFFTHLSRISEYFSEVHQLLGLSSPFSPSSLFISWLKLGDDIRYRRLSPSPPKRKARKEIDAPYCNLLYKVNTRLSLRLVSVWSSRQSSLESDHNSLIRDSRPRRILETVLEKHAAVLNIN